MNIRKLALFSFVALLLGACNRPIARFTYEGNDKPAPARVEFKNESEKAEMYEWDFGDGNFSTAESPTHRYTSSGNYLVRLEAKKGNKSRILEQRVQIDAPEICLVEIETDYGNMLVQLSDATPQHRDNFIKLAEEGFFDGLLFHRVIDGFMIQGGDPDSKNAKEGQPLGRGGPGYRVPAEFVDSLVHVKGALAAARQSDNVNPNRESSGSQFYLVDGREVAEQMLNQVEAETGIRYTTAQRKAYLEQGGTPFLDRKYTVFGQVIDGLEVIDKIAEVERDPRNRPKKDVKMIVRVIK